MDQVIHDTISTSPLFKHLSATLIQYLGDRSKLVEFGDGDVIIEEGTSVASLYLMSAGVVRVWTNSMNREVELKKLGAGTYFGEVSLLSGKEATATVEVLQSPVKVVAVDREAVVELVKQDERVRKMLEGVTLARAKDTISKVLK